jgi:hypothetical protein
MLFPAGLSNCMSGHSVFVPVFLCAEIYSQRPAPTDLFTLKTAEKITIDKANIGVEIVVDKLTTGMAITD